MVSALSMGERMPRARTKLHVLKEGEDAARSIQLRDEDVARQFLKEVFTAIEMNPGVLRDPELREQTGRINKLLSDDTTEIDLRKRVEIESLARRERESQAERLIDYIPTETIYVGYQGVGYNLVAGVPMKVHPAVLLILKQRDDDRQAARRVHEALRGSPGNVATQGIELPRSGG